MGLAISGLFSHTVYQKIMSPKIAYGMKLKVCVLNESSVRVGRFQY